MRYTKYLSILSLCLCSALSVQAADRPSIAQIVRNPKSFIGKTIEFQSAHCVDDPKAGFICLLKSPSHTIRIEAGALGMAGGDEVAERLIGPCKGRQNLESSTCQFDIEITPASALTEAAMTEFEGERVTKLYSGVINMRTIRRR